jgi:hypothetical protein
LKWIGNSNFNTDGSLKPTVTFQRSVRLIDEGTGYIYPFSPSEYSLTDTSKNMTATAFNIFGSSAPSPITPISNFIIDPSSISLITNTLATTISGSIMSFKSSAIIPPSKMARITSTSFPDVSGGIYLNKTSGLWTMELNNNAQVGFIDLSFTRSNFDNSSYFDNSQNLVNNSIVSYTKELPIINGSFCFPNLPYANLDYTTSNNTRFATFIWKLNLNATNFNLPTVITFNFINSTGNLVTNDPSYAYLTVSKDTNVPRQQILLFFAICIPQSINQNSPSSSNITSTTTWINGGLTSKLAPPPKSLSTSGYNKFQLSNILKPNLVAVPNTRSDFTSTLSYITPPIKPRYGPTSTGSWIDSYIVLYLGIPSASSENAFRFSDINAYYS